MTELEFILKTDYIELIKLLKYMNIAESGAQAKLMVENGEVLRNEEPEYRKRAKIIKGDTLEIFDNRIVIK
jgi:ribosome-associated protein